MFIDNLYSLLKEKDKKFHLKNEVTESTGSSKQTIDLNSSNVLCDSLEFNNVIFKQSISLSGFALKGNITFVNCTFQGGIKIHGITLNSGDVTTEFKHQASLTFYKCEFEGTQSLQISQNCVLNGLTDVVECTNVKSLTIFNSKFSSLTIRKCEVLEVFNLTNNIFESEFGLQNSIIGCQIRHDNNEFGSLVLLENKFKKDLFFKDNSIVNHFSINANTFEEEMNVDPFDSVGVESKLTLIDNIFKKGLKFKAFNSGGCKKVFIGSNSFVGGLLISGDNPLQKPNPIDEFNLSFSNNNEGLIKISNLTIFNLLINGENYKGNIILKNIFCNKLKINAFSNYSNFQFINLQPCLDSSLFQVTESHLEKVQFVNCRLDTFNEYNIIYSNFSSVKSANTKWFVLTQLLEKIKKVNSVNGWSKEIKKTQRENIYLEVKEVFRQLKYAMDQQGDRFQSLEFRSFEMEAYFNYLKLVKKRFSKDRFVLFLGKSNEHGINWKRPLFILIISTLFFYIFLFYSASPDFVFGYGHLNLKQFIAELWEYKKVMIEMFNPTHSPNKMFPEGFYVSGFVLGFDLFYKIVFSYLVFQTISAFRKFIK